MMINISLNDLLIIILLIAAIAAVIYLALVLRKLLGTLKEVDDVMEDVKFITSTAKDKVEDVDGIITGVSDAVSGLAGSFKGNENFFNSATNFVKAATSLVGIVKGKDTKEK